MVQILKSLFGSKNDREVKRFNKIVSKVNGLEKTVQPLSDADLAAKRVEFNLRFEAGESLDQLLPEAFAVCREASIRFMELRHFDVQMIGGMALHQGKVAEMRTGEGKTLVATLAVYLNAIPANGVHVVTVNDYLAQRDGEWMRPIYEGLGLSVGIILSGQDSSVKRVAYACDVTYGTNNEFGFDYLRDNMAFSAVDKVQRPLNFAIVDEVDSILIDEARTPLIISGPVEDNTQMYITVNGLVPLLEIQPKVEGDEDPTGHYTYDESHKTIELTEAGHQFVEELLVGAELLAAGESLYAATNLTLLHHVHAGLKALVIFSRNVDYIVQDDQIVIVDEHTGRTMPGRRWSEGIHQAIEAKEGVTIQKESQTMASTTFQNYFRLYDKLAGMTGTADTEAFELHQIYDLDVLVIPTNVDVKRKDMNDLVYLTMAEKFDAIIEDIRHCVKQQSPVLVGTASIEMSEMVSQALTKADVPHNVLNAKQHEREASIIAEAGRPGAVTIATNMAGRGTDIGLGGKLEVELAALGENATDAEIQAAKADWQIRHDLVLAAGGLHIIGTERHESRRIDNQLRGRAGRQGDPGSSRFFLSLEDNLLRIFAPERIKGLMQKLGMEKGEAIEHRMVSNAIEKSQRKVEGRNFDMRKQLLEYDDVANDQRTVVYDQRNELMSTDDIADVITNVRAEVVDSAIDSFIAPQSLAEQWDVSGLETELEKQFGMALPVQEWLDGDDRLEEEGLRTRIQTLLSESYQSKTEVVGAETIRGFEKQVMLQVIDSRWKEHLATMDMLRQGIHLRGYAQKNPKQEYKRESFDLFQQLLFAIKEDVIRILSHVQVRSPAEVEAEERQKREQAQAAMQFRHEQAQTAGQQQQREATPKNPAIPSFKVGRNEPCPCGSGKKYKQCHGKLS
ncbi:MAG: preprotein translocase subunit SecA [Candidatus Paceibacteria bacterium]|jgi:preprotein translocase subunit SecA|tara:strand:- start:1980 stop:4691 length:2712 start_codon:yes stop_codon:yes gene_type:complete